MKTEDLLKSAQLGKKSTYVDTYSPYLLFQLPRQPKRDEIGINESKLPFTGCDIWTGFELSWLNPKGKPQVAIAKMVFPCESRYLAESKSQKLYFNSFNNSKLTPSSRSEKLSRRIFRKFVRPKLTSNSFN